MNKDPKLIAVSRWPSAVLAGLLAAMIAHEAGVEWWRDWGIGDACDIGVAVMALTASLLRFAESLSVRTEPEKTLDHQPAAGRNR